jgi:hypothetical protein
LEGLLVSEDSTLLRKHSHSLSRRSRAILEILWPISLLSQKRQMASGTLKPTDRDSTEPAPESMTPNIMRKRVSLIGSPRTCRSVCDVGVRKSVWSVGVIQGLGVAVEGLGFRRDLGSGFRV